MILKDILRQEFSKHNFIRFDSFIISQLGYDTGNINDEMRLDAFARFRELTDNKKIASYTTMKKWFGIDGFAEPRREQVYEICFLLNVPEEKVSDYFTIGLSAPAFQINDYIETIFMYGIHKGLSYETCLSLIDLFENNLEENRVFDHTKMTYQLKNQFEIKKELPETDFIMWMLEYAGLFKGYSKTALEYLESLREEINNQIKKEAADRINDYLAETGYEMWRRKNLRYNEEAKDTIKRYIKRLKKDRTKKTDDIVNNINEMYKIVYGDSGANTRLLSEVYDTKHNNNSYPDWLRRVDAKYLSDLLNVAGHKERQLRTRQALKELSELSDSEACPDWIACNVESYSKGKCVPVTAGDAREWLEEDSAEHRRRCHIVERNDLLPLILYISQNKHLQVIHSDYEQYDCQVAKSEFIRIANATLTACNMETLSDRYQLDVALLCCFQNDEMFSFPDLLDAVVEL